MSQSIFYWTWFRCSHPGYLLHHTAWGHRHHCNSSPSFCGSNQLAHVAIYHLANVNKLVLNSPIQGYDHSPPSAEITHILKYWKTLVVIMPTLPSLVASEVVITTTWDATSDAKVVIMTIPGFQRGKWVQRIFAALSTSVLYTDDPVQFSCSVNLVAG